LSVAALVIGASQDPTKEAIREAKQANVEFRKRHARSRNCPGELPDTLTDVVAVQQFLEHEYQNGVEVAVERFVGRCDTNSLTRKAFLNKLNRLLADPEPSLYILYYAGHGTESTDATLHCSPGAFCMQPIHEGFVSIDDLVNAWHGPDIGLRRGKRFLVVADSCHSGAMVEALRAVHEERVRRRQPDLNMAVQSACGADEVAYGGTFTNAFLHFQEYSGDFDWHEYDQKKKQHPDYSSFTLNPGNES
jgi:hypothetical protein